MAKDPAFLFYPGDYLRDTQCLSERAQVAYDRIMCEHMRNICITQAQLDFFTKRLTADEKSEILMVLTKISGGFQISWVAESIEKRREYSDSRRKNRISKKESKPKDMKTYVKHMENEIEDVIENEKVTVNAKSKLEIFEELFSDAQFIEGLASAHRGKDLKQAFEECYIHHSNAPNPPRELWQWRQKFNTWLTIKKTEKNGKGINNKQQHTDSLKDSIRNTYGNLGAK